MPRRSSRSSATARCGSPTSAATCWAPPTSCSRATRAIPLATGILNIWMHDAGRGHRGRRGARRRPRPSASCSGLGASHAAVVDADSPGATRGRYSTMVAYLDALDAQPQPLPPRGRILAALGPRMLELARERAAGAHPYLVHARAHARLRARRSGRDRAARARALGAARADASGARARARVRRRLPAAAQLRQQPPAARLRRGRPGRRAGATGWCARSSRPATRGDRRARRGASRGRRRPRRDPRHRRRRDAAARLRRWRGAAGRRAAPQARYERRAAVTRSPSAMQFHEAKRARLHHSGSAGPLESTCLRSA